MCWLTSYIYVWDVSRAIGFGFSYPRKYLTLMRGQHPVIDQCHGCAEFLGQDGASPSDITGIMILAILIHPYMMTLTVIV